MPKKRDQDTTDYQPPPLPAGSGAEALVTVETQREQDLFSGKLAQRTFVKLYVAARESGLLAEISDRDWKTLCTLATYMDGDGYCYPSQAELARAMGCSRQMANERIKSLSAFRFKGQQVLLVVKEGRTEKGEWARNGYRVLPISRLRIYDAPESREQGASANDSANETDTTVSRNLDTASGGKATVSSPTVTVPLDTKKNQRKPDLDLSKFEESHDIVEETDEGQAATYQSAQNGISMNGTAAPSSSTPGYASLKDLIAQRRKASGGPRRGRPVGSSDERERLRAFLSDFSVELGDEAPLSSTITRTLNIFKAAGVPPEQWGDIMYQARGLTQEHTAQIRKTAADGGGGLRRKNKMPYFLATLEQLVGLRPEPERSPRDIST